VRDSLLTP